MPDTPAAPAPRVLFEGPDKFRMPPLEYIYDNQNITEKSRRSLEDDTVEHVTCTREEWSEIARALAERDREIADLKTRLEEQTDGRQRAQDQVDRLLDQIEGKGDYDDGKR